jgi:hypothetical protein
MCCSKLFVLCATLPVTHQLWDFGPDFACTALSCLVCLQLEVTLGRIAMIGFVGLILNEAYFQRPFFPHLF